MYIKETSAGLVKVASLPNQYESETINCAGGFATLSAEDLRSEGFYPLVEPTYNSETHRLGDFKKVGDHYSYVVNKLTADELFLKGWHHPEFSKRIIAPSALIDEYPNIAIWMQLNNLPITLSDDTLTCYLYMNIVKPQHQALVDSLQGSLTIEELPI